jgi:serine O-acetyltransferase
MNTLIKSKDDYRFFLSADKIALNCTRRRPRFYDEIWRFELLLRKVEFFMNCKKGYFNKVYLDYLRVRKYNLGLKLGFSIPANVFGPGLSIAHYGTIVVGDEVSVGANCRIHQCVTIGVSAGKQQQLSPIIGDNVFIGPGAVIVGPIKIADGVAIGANSYVNKSFTEPEVTIAGAPAKIVSGEGSKGLYHRSTEILMKQRLSAISQ